MSDRHPNLIIPPDERKTLQTIARNECRSPYGDPLHPDFYLAGSIRRLVSANFICGAVSWSRPALTARTFQSCEKLTKARFHSVAGAAEVPTIPLAHVIAGH